jgi:hypothetical protein
MITASNIIKLLREDLLEADIYNQEGDHTINLINVGAPTRINLSSNAFSRALYRLIITNNNENVAFTRATNSDYALSLSAVRSRDLGFCIENILAAKRTFRQFGFLIHKSYYILIWQI